MKRFMIFAPLALAGCAAIPAVPSSPAAVADQSALDEQAALSVELAYKAARLVVETGVDGGLIKGTLATRIAAYDRRAYAAVIGVRSAYEAGNADGYLSAVQEARAAITAILTAVQGDAS